MERKIRKRRKSPVVAFLLFALSVTAAVLLGFKYYELCDTEKTEEKRFLPASIGVSAGRKSAGLTLFSSNAILFDPDSGDTIYTKGDREKIYPASLTKIMTALIAVENISDLDSPVTLQYSDYAGLYEQNAAMAGFSLGEAVTARDLLYATLLPSGAEAATALARASAGSVEQCVELMNSRAAELGMENTHFVNVTGLHDDEHYTTVYDLSLLLREAISHNDFFEPYCSLYYSTTPTEQHPNGLQLVSTIVPRLKQLEREKPPIIGNKTGYTDEAQMCLASVAESGGVRRALVTVGAEGDSRSEPTQLIDAYLLYQKSLPN